MTDHSQGRLLAIGDIHGCRALLEQLLALVRPTRGDELVFVGDYIDRGEDSKGVIETVLELSQDVTCIALRGNHEDMALGALNGEEDKTNLFLYNGGLTTLASYGHQLEDLHCHAPFLQNTKMFHQNGQCLFVHAGLKPGRDLAQQTDHDLMWIRHEYLNAPNQWGQYIVSGHNPVYDPIVSPDGKILVDTGAVYAHKGYGWLTCAEIRTDSVVFHQVSEQGHKQCGAALPPLNGGSCP